MYKMYAHLSKEGNDVMLGTESRNKKYGRTMIRSKATTDIYERDENCKVLNKKKFKKKIFDAFVSII